MSAFRDHTACSTSCYAHKSEWNFRNQHSLEITNPAMSHAAGSSDLSTQPAVKCGISGLQHTDYLRVMTLSSEKQHRSSHSVPACPKGRIRAGGMHRPEGLFSLPLCLSLRHLHALLGRVSCRPLEELPEPAICVHDHIVRGAWE